MESQQRPDCLADETVDVLLEVFDVQHVFPKEFVRKEVKRGYWRRLWDSIAARLGFRKRHTAKGQRQPRVGEGRGGIAVSVPVADRGRSKAPKERAQGSEP